MHSSSDSVSNGGGAKSQPRLLTVITVVKNNLEGLKKTYACLERQTRQDFEWLVADGESTDGTREWLGGVKRPHFRSVSRKDRSLWEAMNKAISEVRTEYCIFLNSGDFFWDDDVVAKILRCAEVEPFEFAYGQFVIGAVPGYPQRVRGDRIRNTLEMFYGRVPCHQASILSKRAFETMGGYREDLGIHGDREWILRYAKLKGPASFRYLPFVVVYYDPHGLSYSRFFKWGKTYLAMCWRLGNLPEAAAGLLGWIKSATYIISSRMLGKLKASGRGAGVPAGKHPARPLQ